MSVGNLGAVMNQLESMIGTDLGTTSTASARSNQGIAMLPGLVQRVLSRADFANTLNAKIVMPVTMATSTVVAVAVPCSLVAVVFDNNETSAASWLHLYDHASAATIGTTEIHGLVYALAGTQTVALYPAPVPFAAGIVWNAATAGEAATTRSTTLKCSAMFIYTA